MRESVASTAGFSRPSAFPKPYKPGLADTPHLPDHATRSELGRSIRILLDFEEPGTGLHWVHGRKPLDGRDVRCRWLRGHHHRLYARPVSAETILCVLKSSRYISDATMPLDNVKTRMRAFNLAPYLRLLQADSAFVSPTPTQSPPTNSCHSHN